MKDVKYRKNDAIFPDEIREGPEKAPSPAIC